jgi:hypothetical protein
MNRERPRVILATLDPDAPPPLVGLDRDPGLTLYGDFSEVGATTRFGSFGVIPLRDKNVSALDQAFREVITQHAPGAFEESDKPEVHLKVLLDGNKLPRSAFKQLDLAGARDFLLDLCKTIADVVHYAGAMVTAIPPKDAKTLRDERRSLVESLVGQEVISFRLLVGKLEAVAVTGKMVIDQGDRFGLGPQRAELWNWVTNSLSALDDLQVIQAPAHEHRAIQAADIAAYVGGKLFASHWRVLRTKDRTTRQAQNLIAEVKYLDSLRHALNMQHQYFIPQHIDRPGHVPPWLIGFVPEGALQAASAVSGFHIVHVRDAQAIA